MDDLRYPIGRFTRPTSALSNQQRAAMIQTIAETPAKLRRAVHGLDEKQLDTPYRPGGWTVRQVVHHVPDSHMNAYVRFKLGLTEDVPTIKPYDEARWADLSDVRDTPTEVSLTLMDALHDRWVRLLQKMDARDFARTITHPDWKGPLSLDAVLALYAWHGPHHVGHITGLRQRMGWG